MLYVQYWLYLWLFLISGAKSSRIAIKNIVGIPIIMAAFTIMFQLSMLDANKFIPIGTTKTISMRVTISGVSICLSILTLS